MSKQTEALKLALEALEECRRDPRLKYEHPYYDKTITAIREALAEQPAPVQGWKLVPVEPTPEQIKEGNKVTWPLPCAQVYSAMLAAAPQPAPPPQRKPLTDEQIVKCWGQVSGTRYGYVAFARAIEAAHGIKENT